MRIVIVGAGDVGSHLARLLSNEDHDIMLVDQNQEKLDDINSKYNLMTLVGNPTEFSVLRDAGAPLCDLFIAVTPYETDNVVACAMAHSLGAKRTVARIENYDLMAPENKDFTHRMGVDSMIYPEYLAAEEISVALKRTWVRHWFELHDGALVVVGVKLRANAPVVGTQLRDFSYAQRNFHVSIIKRNHEIIIPRGDDYMRAGDIVYFTTTKQHVDELMELCGKHNINIRRLMIMGGAKIAVRLAKWLSHQYKIKIIDNSLERCRVLPQKCPGCEVIYGDARDIDLLQDEGIEDSDAFIALSDNSEANILTCLTARKLGVGKTIAEVENIQYISQAEELNIGTIINKKLIASSKIFQLLLDADSSTAKCLALADAEVAELEARPGSKITKAPVKDITLPRSMTLAGLIRDGEGSLISGNTHIMAGDHVVVVCLTGTLHIAEKFFI